MLFLNILEDEKEIPTPIETCSKAMFRGITEYLQGNTTSLNRIEVVSPAEGVVEAFQMQMNTDTCLTI